MDFQLPTAATTGAVPAALGGCFPVPFFFCPPGGDAMIYPMLFPPAGPCFLPAQAMAPLGPYASPPPCFLAAMGAMAAAAAAAAPCAWAAPQQALPPPRACESSASYSPAKARALQPPGALAPLAQRHPHPHHHMYRRDYNCSRTSLVSSSRSRRACATPPPLPLPQAQPAAADGEPVPVARAAPAPAKAPPQLVGKEAAAAVASAVLAPKVLPAARAGHVQPAAVPVSGAVSLETESDRSAASGAGVAFGFELKQQELQKQEQALLMQSPFLSPLLTAPQLQLSCFQLGPAPATQSLTAASPPPRSKHSLQAVDARRSVSGLGTVSATPAVAAAAAAVTAGAAEGRVALQAQGGAGGMVWVDSRRVRAVLRRRQQRGRTAAAALGVAPEGLKARLMRTAHGKASGSPTSSASSAMEEGGSDSEEGLLVAGGCGAGPQQLLPAGGGRSGAAHVSPAAVAPRPQPPQPQPPQPASAAAAATAAEARAALEAELAAVLAEDSEAAGVLRSGFLMDGSSVSNLETTATAGTTDEVLTELVC